MQIVLSGNRVLAYGEDCFLCMGGTVICEDTGKAYQNATVAEVEAIPADIDTVGYEYHAGIFVPCAPYGEGDGSIMVACEDCGTPKRSKVTVDADGGLNIPGYLTGGKVSDEVSSAFGLTDGTVDDALTKLKTSLIQNNGAITDVLGNLISIPGGQITGIDSIKIANGTYTGANATTKTLSFDFLPKFLIVTPDRYYYISGNTGYDAQGVIIYPTLQEGSIITNESNYTTQLTVSVSGNSVTWTSSDKAGNNSKHTFYYFAIG